MPKQIPIAPIARARYFADEERIAKRSVEQAEAALGRASQRVDQLRTKLAFAEAESTFQQQRLATAKQRLGDAKVGAAAMTDHT